MHRFFASLRMTPFSLYQLEKIHRPVFLAAPMGKLVALLTCSIFGRRDGRKAGPSTALRSARDDNSSGVFQDVNRAKIGLSPIQEMDRFEHRLADHSQAVRADFVHGVLRGVVVAVGKCDGARAVVDVDNVGAGNAALDEG